jgi:hypothetical protein
MHIDISTYLGETEITISCYVRGGSCESFKAYIHGRRAGKAATAFAEDYLQSVDGIWRLADACADAGI